MMSSDWAANIKLLYAVDTNQFSAIDTIYNGDTFDVIANVDIGENLMQVIDTYDLFVFVRNLSQSNTLLSNQVNDILSPQAGPLKLEIRVSFPGGWVANEGDVLEAIAAFKVSAGVHTDYSSKKSDPFVVSIS